MNQVYPACQSHPIGSRALRWLSRCHAALRASLRLLRFRERPELLLFIGLLCVFNAPVLFGSCWRSMMFQEDPVLHGQGWRLITHPFVHVTWYHLLLDATAFVTLYAGLLDNSLFRRLSYIIGAVAGSVLLSSASSAGLAHGLCGLSGIAHGLMAVSALEMVASTSSDSASRRLGWFSFTLVVAKAGFEAVTGRLFLEFLNFGLLGDPVAVSHAGGIVGALGVFLVLGLKSAPPTDGSRLS